MQYRHRERHVTSRIGWLRAAVLGANDGIVSTASLVMGVAAAHAAQSSILLTGTAGLVAGAMSMAAGEYVSVHSQADSEHADLARESKELEADEESEHRELAAIYVQRGLDPELAREVATQLMAHNALDAHMRDELGHHGNTQGAPFAGRCGVGRQFCRGRRTAAAGGYACPKQGLAGIGVCDVTDLPCAAGRVLVKCRKFW